MKKIIITSLILLACISCVIAAPLFFERGGGEIWFEATIDRVDGQNHMAYATVTDQNAGLFFEKLPGQIRFHTSDLDETLNPGDEISGSYLNGTIDGQDVRVVSVSVIQEAE